MPRALQALVAGLQWTVRNGTRVEIRILNRDVYVQAKQVMEELRESPVPAEIQEPDLATAHGRGPLFSRRNAVFISYSHKDRKWLERLQVHLKPLERGRVISRWDDTLIQPGTHWREEIRRAVEAAKVAILLVSADFLASDYIAHNEPPPLLKAAKAEGAVIPPVIGSACGFTREEQLSAFQAINDPAKPLLRVGKAKQEETFAKVADEVEKAFKRGKS
jgi:hypothetical protein